MRKTGSWKKSKANKPLSFTRFITLGISIAEKCQLLDGQSSCVPKLLRSSKNHTTWALQNLRFSLQVSRWKLDQREASQKTLSLTHLHTSENGKRFHIWIWDNQNSRTHCHQVATCRKHWCSYNLAIRATARLSIIYLSWELLETKLQVAMEEKISKSLEMCGIPEIQFGKLFKKCKLWQLLPAWIFMKCIERLLVIRVWSSKDLQVWLWVISACNGTAQQCSKPPSICHSNQKNKHQVSVRKQVD